MVQFGNGFTWSEVYHMPSYLRKFYFNKLIELKKKEAEEHKKAHAADKFVTKFFDGLSNGAANSIIRKAEQAKLPKEAIDRMKKMEKDAEEFRKFLDSL